MFISDKRKPVEEVSMVWSPSKCLLKSTYVYLDVEEPEDIVVVRREELLGERITVTSLTVDGKPTKGTDEHLENLFDEPISFFGSAQSISFYSSKTSFRFNKDLTESK